MLKSADIVKYPLASTKAAEHGVLKLQGHRYYYLYLAYIN